MKPDGALIIDSRSMGLFFRQWVLMLSPYHGLSGRLIDLFALMLLWRWERSSIEDSPELLDEWFFSTKTKKEFMKATGLSVVYYSIVMKRLRDSGVIDGRRFNLRYVPRVDRSTGKFDLLLRFRFIDGEGE